MSSTPISLLDVQIQELIASIYINEANLENIAKSKIISGSLLTELRRVLKSAALINASAKESENGGEKQENYTLGRYECIKDLYMEVTRSHEFVKGKVYFAHKYDADNSTTLVFTDESGHDHLMGAQHIKEYLKYIGLTAKK